MKKLLTFLSFIIVFSFQTNAQLSIARVGLSVGGDIEMPHGLDHNYILKTAVDNDFDVSSVPFGEGEMVRMDCDNGFTKLSVALKPAGKTNTEIQLAFMSIDNRIDMVRYELPEEGHFAEVSAENNEIAIEGLYMFRQKAKKTFSFNVGVGTNIGYSGGGKVHIRSYYQTDPDTDIPATTEEINLEYDQKNSINQRLFVQGGFGIRFFKRMEFEIVCRKGLGYRASIDGPFKFTTLKRSIGMGLNYMF